jgi:hypothetical protein
MHNGEHRWELKFDLECSLRLLLRSRAHLDEAWLVLASKRVVSLPLSPNVVEGEFSEVRAEPVRLASCTSRASLKRGGHLL